MVSNSNTKKMAHPKQLDWDLLKELECLEHMEPPIRLCKNGHSICDSCGLQVSNCPSCRRTFTKARNFSLERIAATAIYPCKNREASSEETFTVNHKTVIGPGVCFRPHNVLLEYFLKSNVLGLLLFLTL